jgi:hypothetical protein
VDGGRRWGLRVALAVVGVLVLLLVAAQLLLPGIAARKVREKVGRYGTVVSAHVSAFPAVELLWGHGDSASVSAGALSLSSTQGVDLLWEARGMTNATFTATSLQVDSVQLNRVVVSKRGSAVVVQGTVSETSLGGALPSGLELHSVTDAGGHVVVQATGSILGVSATVPVVVQAQEGRLVAEPQGLPLGGLATLTVFSDPRLRMESIDVSPVASVGGAPNLLLTLRGTLQGS